MKILFFSQYFWPENFRINELVSYFKDKYRSIVLTSTPSYPNKNLYKNYKRKNDRIFKKLEIIRIPVIGRQNNNIFIILNYFSFIFLSFFFGIYVFLKKKFDVIFIFCPSPILASIPIIFLNKIFKKKIIIWVLDLWPDTVVDLKIIENKMLINFLKKIIKFIYSNSDLILAQSKSIKSEIKRLTDTKCVYFPSWSENNIGRKNKVKTNELVKKNKKTTRIIFAGNIGESQSFVTLVKAANILKNNKKNIEWIIIGDGRWKKKLLNLINKKKIK